MHEFDHTFQKRSIFGLYVMQCQVLDAGKEKCSGYTPRYSQERTAKDYRSELSDNETQLSTEINHALSSSHTRVY